VVLDAVAQMDHAVAEATLVQPRGPLSDRERSSMVPLKTTPVP
jgi:hypothetical protein